VLVGGFCEGGGSLTTVIPALEMERWEVVRCEEFYMYVLPLGLLADHANRGKGEWQGPAESLAHHGLHMSEPYYLMPREDKEWGLEMGANLARPAMKSARPQKPTKLDLYSSGVVSLFSIRRRPCHQVKHFTKAHKGRHTQQRGGILHSSLIHIFSSSGISTMKSHVTILQSHQHCEHTSKKQIPLNPPHPHPHASQPPQPSPSTPPNPPHPPLHKPPSPSP
jgi:hypothetical protein